MSDSVQSLEDSIIEEFAAQIRGELILPQDSNYDDTRKVYNAMIDKRPGMIVKCMDVADVINAVNFGRENNFLVAVVDLRVIKKIINNLRVNYALKIVCIFRSSFFKPSPKPSESPP